MFPETNQDSWKNKTNCFPRDLALISAQYMMQQLILTLSLLVVALSE